MLNQIFIVLVDWNKSLWVDILINLGTLLSQFWANQYLLLFFNAVFLNKALTNFKLEGEVEDNRAKWGDFWEKLMPINRNIVCWSYPSQI